MANGQEIAKKQWIFKKTEYEVLWKEYSRIYTIISGEIMSECSVKNKPDWY